MPARRAAPRNRVPTSTSTSIAPNASDLPAEGSAPSRSKRAAASSSRAANAAEGAASASVTRPALPTRTNPLLPQEIPVVKLQVIRRPGCNIIIGRMKLPTTGDKSSAFLLRRFDTDAISASSMFRVAFPWAEEEEEKKEMAYLQSRFDCERAKGSLGLPIMSAVVILRSPSKRGRKSKAEKAKEQAEAEKAEKGEGEDNEVNDGKEQTGVKGQDKINRVGQASTLATSNPASQMQLAGTWVPTADASEIAQQYGILRYVQPLLEARVSSHSDGSGAVLVPLKGPSDHSDSIASAPRRKRTRRTAHITRQQVTRTKVSRISPASILSLEEIENEVAQARALAQRVRDSGSGPSYSHKRGATDEGQNTDGDDTEADDANTEADDANIEAEDANVEAVVQLTDLAISRHRALSSRVRTGQPVSTLSSDRLGSIRSSVPQRGWGLKQVAQHLLSDIVPALNPTLDSTRNIGFGAGDALPIEVVADWLATVVDPNVQVHLPDETLSTLVEAETLRMLLSLLSLPSSVFTGSVCTGAATSNLLAILCGRERVLRYAMAARGQPNWSFAEEGFGDDGVPSVKIFSANPRVSICKAAALAGIGRKNVVDVSLSASHVLGSLAMSEMPEHEKHLSALVSSTDFDLTALEEQLHAAHDEKRGSIVVVGFGEVSTGAPSVQIPEIANLCRQYGAWLHVDAAFSGFIGLMEGMEWVQEHLALADSITADAHKALNVPYESAFLLVRKDSAVDQLSYSEHVEDAPTDHACELDRICGSGAGPAPTHLSVSETRSAGSSGASDDDAAAKVEHLRSAYVRSLPSPLFRNRENLRRFNALPIYASLLLQGRNGISELVTSQVHFARRVEAWLRNEEGGGKWYEVLTPSRSYRGPQTWEAGGAWGSNIVLFRARPMGSLYSPASSPACGIIKFTDPDTGNMALAAALTEGGKMDVSTMLFGGIGAVQIAISDWATGLAGEGQEGGSSALEDSAIVIQRLKDVMQGR